MRYVTLLVCLWVATMAHAYNETITSIAYNPSRMGAYDYLKVNKLKLKGGFRATGNTTEINLYGNISIVDNSTGHQNYLEPEKLNMIAKIKPLSNYSPTGGYTFCTRGQNWLYNSKACSGYTILETDRMTGVVPVNYHYSGGSISSSYLIPDVYVYGKNGVNDIVVSSSSSDYSRIQKVLRMYVSGSSIETEDKFPDNLSLTTDNLSAGGSSAEVRITGTLTLGGVGLSSSSAFDRCSNSSYSWVTRVTDDHKEVDVLACR